MTDNKTEPAVEAIARLVPAILRGLQALEVAGRQISPATLIELIDAVADRAGDLVAALDASRAIDWPQPLASARACLEQAAEAARDGIAGLQEAAAAPQPMLQAYRALRN